MYGLGMSNRLSKTDWLEMGLSTLVTSGVEALKADPLAKAMGVTRGSFYWHFADVESYRDNVLSLWRERSTDQIIGVVEQMDPGSDKLGTLLRRAFLADRSLERAIRVWAIQSEDAAKAVTVVDERRVRYISSLLIEAGVSPDLAASRARVIYWAYLGQLLVFDSRLASIDGIDLEDVNKTIQAT